MSKPKIYLCGGIEGLDRDGACNWREKLKREYNEYFDFIDPTDGIKWVNGKIETDLCPQDIVELDKEMIRKSDIVLADLTIKGRSYFGSAMELVYQKSLSSIPRKLCYIVYGNNFHARDNPWVREHCDNMFVYHKEAMDYLIENYLE